MLKDLHGRLRPLGITDILDETIDLYRSNFVLLVGISGVLNVPYAVVSGFIEASKPGGMTGKVLNLLAAVVIGSLVTGALTFAISDRYLGRPTSVGASYGRVLKSSVFAPLLGAMLLKDLIALAPLVAVAVVGAGAMAAAAMQGSTATAVAAGIGILALLPPALVWAAYFGIKFLLVEPAVILEQVGAGGALSRSWNLTAGSWWKALGLSFIVVGIMVVIVGIVTAPAAIAIAAKTQAGQPISHSILAINTVLTALVQTLMAPWVSIAWILLYYDMRIRKEGFDLELMARELDMTHPYFVSIKNLVFPNSGSLIINPSQDDIRKKFGSTNHIMLPFQTVTLIEEVDEKAEEEKKQKVRPFSVVEGEETVSL